MAFKLKINGADMEVEAAPETPLLWALRDYLGLTGTKFGCGIAQCGACTVHIDGVATRSCQFPVETAVGTEITTIEGLDRDGQRVLQTVWAQMNVPQCGYCQSGIVMAVASLLKNIPEPTDADIDLYVDNICRCGTYPRVRAAIHKAAELMKA